MAEIPGVGAILEGIKARMAQIEQQLRHHRDLSDERERLRGALDRLEGGVAARVRGRRTSAGSALRRTTAASEQSAPGTGSATATRRRGALAPPRSDARADPRGAQGRSEDGGGGRRGDRGRARDREHDAEQARQDRGRSSRPNAATGCPDSASAEDRSRERKRAAESHGARRLQLVSMKAGGVSSPVCGDVVWSLAGVTPL
jgi:hypothetical protein